MQAMIFARHGGPEVLELAELPLPEPGPGEVRLRVRASSLNHLDLWVRRGLPFPIPLPHVGGADIAGEVDACGPGVEGIPAGLRVAVDPSLHFEWYDGARRGAHLAPPPFGIIGEHTRGGLAEYAVVPAANLVELPEGVAWEDAAAAGLVFATAWSALFTRGKLLPGERVLVTAASGGVGTAAIQLARNAGAEVLAVTSGEERVQRVLGLGADLVVDREAGSLGSQLRDVVPEGVDLVLDSVGGAFWGPLVRVLRPGGRLVTVGSTAGHEASLDLRHVFWKRLSLLGSTMASPADFARAMNAVFSGAVAPVIDRVLPLARVAEGHRALEAGEVFGKVAIRV